MLARVVGITKTTILGKKGLMRPKLPFRCLSESPPIAGYEGKRLRYCGATTSSIGIWHFQPWQRRLDDEVVQQATKSQLPASTDWPTNPRISVLPQGGEFGFPFSAELPHFFPSRLIESRKKLWQRRIFQFFTLIKLKFIRCAYEACKRVREWVAFWVVLGGVRWFGGLSATGRRRFVLAYCQGNQTVPAYGPQQSPGLLPTTPAKFQRFFFFFFVWA